MVRTPLLLGSLFGFIAVAAGAFGAHALRDRLDAYSLGVWNTAAQYQMTHSMALLLIGAFALSRPGITALRLSTWCFSLGILIFCGSLYALALSGTRWLGAITPLGGLLFLVGWAALAVFALKLFALEER
ncbi:MAG: DUF423 domain-containing protein [Candidatus Sumerlaeaceae bacterium]